VEEGAVKLEDGKEHLIVARSERRLKIPDADRLIDCGSVAERLRMRVALRIRPDDRARLHCWFAAMSALLRYASGAEITGSGQ
jgi:hypothetical protein